MTSSTLNPVSRRMPDQPPTANVERISVPSISVWEFFTQFDWDGQVAVADTATRPVNAANDTIKPAVAPAVPTAIPNPARSLAQPTAADQAQTVAQFFRTFDWAAGAIDAIDESIDYAAIDPPSTPISPPPASENIQQSLDMWMLDRPAVTLSPDSAALNDSSLADFSDFF
jgi:hypothetical protein